MLNEIKRAALAAIDEKADLFASVGDKIWEYAELSLLEKKSCKLYCEELRALGFTVTENFDNIETAFKATYGHGKPHIGILAEYDALSGLSQEAGTSEKKPLVPGAAGHGCGHNLLGEGSMAAAVAVKRYLEATGREGTVTLYGCPGEEGLSSKSYMARDGVWQELDAAVTWHPSDVFGISSGASISSIQKEYHFKGVSSHAAAVPHLGRSALDAVELMNIGVQFLREHMPATARVHYSITDAGGVSPNVVQAEAKVLYMVRDANVLTALKLQERVDTIAKAAAMMTETQLAIHFVDGTADTVPNETLERLAQECCESVELPKFTDEEFSFAREIIATYENPSGQLPGSAARESKEIAKAVSKLSEGGKREINDFVVPFYHSTASHMGSTDVGDVSWLTPTVQIGAATSPSGMPGHSWQRVACGKCSQAHKATLWAGKVMALIAIELMERPETLEAAKAEFKECTKEGYLCPIPADAVAVAP